MHLSSHFVGRRLKTTARHFTWRDTMNYAAATNDSNPVYFDDERVEGILAPPLFSVALTWPVTANIADLLEDEDFPREVLLSQVHYTEHLHFAIPLKPDATLMIAGRIAAILPHRAGTHVVLRYDAADARGQIVFTEHIGAMLRGVECTDAGSGQTALPFIPRLETKKAPLWDAPLSIDAARPFIYDGCTNISFPIHTSPKFARQVGLPGIILQGTATLALAARELIDREADRDPSRLMEIACRFTGMVQPGTDINIRLEGRRPSENGLELHFSVLNHQGDRAISGGYALLSSNQQEQGN